MKTVLFLVSGNGGTLKFFNEAYKENRINLKVIAVISDRKCGALEYAKEKNIQAHEININKSNQDELKELIQLISADFVITTIHKVLHKDVISYSKSRFINLHYSLLPAYEGLIGMNTVRQAKLDNAKFVGATAHLVSEDVDRGMILGQCFLLADWGANTMEYYYDLVFRGGCLVLLNQLMAFSDNTLISIPTSNYDQLTFNPPLTFSPLEYDKIFWDKLK